ncbi:MATE family efflux transporter [Oryzicola mucosus]|uniref:MATE family efflux transporter n=1 Tax=Oryzicola mucosus TaxID=2767425 RepID=A0A8J6PGZ8_9HYPH|nr:MATE family efflux transporter [Oryzicola mucosus]
MNTSAPTFHEARRIVGLAVPLALVQLAQVAISTTDIIMLGWFGGEALAAGALGFFCFNLLRTMGFGLIVGTSNLVAADKSAGIRGEYLAGGLLLGTAAALLAGIVVALGGRALPLLGQDAHVAAMAAQYLLLIAPGYLPLFWFYAYRGVVVGRRKSGALLAITLATIVVNAALDYGFIYGVFGLPALGAPGVALASTIAYFLQFIAIAAITHGLMSFIAPRQVRQTVRRLLKTGIPTAASYGSEAGFTVVLTLMIGSFGAAALAGHAVVNQVTYVVFMLCIGLSHATSVGVSEGVGGRDPDAVMRAGRSGLLVVAITMTLFSIGWLLAPTQVLALFSLSNPQDAAAVVALSLLPIAAIMQIFDGLQNVGIGALRGINRAGRGFWVTVIGYWFIGIPTAVIFGFFLHGGPVGVWWGLAIGLMATALGMTVIFERDGRYAAIAAV